MDLLERFAAGNLDAFESLFRQHQCAVYRWIVRIVRDPAAAEDLTVETLWRAYKAHARFRPDGGLRACARRGRAQAPNPNRNRLTTNQHRISSAQTATTSVVIAEPADIPARPGSATLPRLPKTLNEPTRRTSASTQKTQPQPRVVAAASSRYA